jgi:hypothetical protein
MASRRASRYRLDMAAPEQELDENQKWWEEFKREVAESDRRIDALLREVDETIKRSLELELRLTKKYLCR